MRTTKSLISSMGMMKVRMEYEIFEFSMVVVKVPLPSTVGIAYE